MKAPNSSNEYDNIQADVKENIDNRVARVFISSTFRDMNRERDYLMSNVFPKIRQYCKERDVEFTPVDLRWGITEEQSKSGQVAEICLQEIKRSRPFFIGILGERYGWEPQSDDLKLDKLETLFPSVRQDVKDRLSITEMEIQNGVLRQKDKLDAAFWFRSEKMETPEEFRETPTSDAYKKLQELKEKIKADERYPNQEYASVEELGKQIYEALIKWIDARFPIGKLTWLAKQNLGQSAFERSRTRAYRDRNGSKTSLYVPNQGAYDALNQFADSSEGSVFVVTGASGNGKSALLANWAQDYRKRRSDVKILTFYVSASERSESPATILRQLTESLDPSSGVDDNNKNDLLSDKEQGKSLDDRKRDFTNAIARRLSRRPEGKLLFIVDGLNQLSDHDDAKKLLWIPLLPQGAKLVLSTIDSDETYKTVKRLNWETYRVDKLTQDQIKKIAQTLLGSRGRELSQNQLDKIANADVMSTPVALRTFLDSLCNFGDFDKLDQEIDRYLNAASIDELFELIFQRIEETIAPDKLRRTATLLAVSRYGLTEDELLQITDCSQYEVSLFLCTFDDSLVNRSGLYSYSHAYIKNAVEKRYATSIAKERDRLIEYFNSDRADFSRRCQEVPYHYAIKESWNELYQFILIPKVLLELYNGTLFCDLCEYWELLLNRPNKEDFPLEDYLKVDDSQYSDDLKASYWNYCGFLASDFNLFDVAKRASGKSLEIYRALAKKNPVAYTLHLASSLNNFGILHYLTDAFTEAEENYREALAIYRVQVKENPDIYNPILAMSLNNLGLLHNRTGAFADAEKEHREAINIRKALAKENPDVYTPDVAQSLNNLANLHSDTGAFAEAEEEYREEINIYRILAKKNPNTYNPDVAMSLNNLGLLHSNTDAFTEAEEEFREAIAIYQTLVRKNPDTYSPDVAMSLNNLGLLHSYTYDFAGADKEYREALAIYRVLAKKFPDAYTPDVAMTLNNLGALHVDAHAFDEAEQELRKAVSIRRSLAKKKPDVYNPDLATSLNNLANLHSDIGAFVEAEEEYHEAIAIRRPLAKKYPDVYNLDLVRSLYNFASLHHRTGSFTEAEQECAEAIARLKELASKDRSVYDSYLAHALKLLDEIRQQNK